MLGAIYFAAFLSLAAQIDGLVGSVGILPLVDYLDAARAELGGHAFRMLPTLFWIDASDAALVAGTFIGCALAVLVILDW